jgi:hypothetical protein
MSGWTVVSRHMLSKITAVDRFAYEVIIDMALFIFQA